MDSSDDRVLHRQEQARAATASGDLRAAVEHLAALEELTRTEFGEDSRLWLDSVIALGDVSLSAGAFARAVPLVERAADRWQARFAYIRRVGFIGPSDIIIRRLRAVDTGEGRGV